MTETDLQREIQIALSDENTRLLRNTVGFGWQGTHFTIRDGKLVAGVARAVTFGLGPGTSDLVGPHSIVVTPAMVGRRIALFTAVEIKRPKKKGATQGQGNFINAIAELGGLSGVARSIEEARTIVTQFDK